MTISRRDFLKTGAVGLGAFFLPPGLARVASASTTAPVLVALYLRGGVDGLNQVVPAGDPIYYDVRPNIQVLPGEEIPLDGFYGLHPALGPLHALYQSQELAFIHACGSPDSSRSHFDAQDFMESAAPGDKTVGDGWLNRYLLSAGRTDAVSGISLNSSKIRSLTGDAPSLAFRRITDFRLRGSLQEERRLALESRYALIPGSLLGTNVLDGFSALDRVASVDTSTTVTYPSGGLARALREAAALVKADIGVGVVAIDTGGWDHHSNEVGRILDRNTDLAASLAAFHQDLGDCANTTLTLCMTEFGRNVAENGNLGTDHGRGGVMLALGGGIAGGRVITANGWPGLEPENLESGRDLAVTTDFRDVFAEALVRHMGASVSETGPVFPDFTVSQASFPGLYT